MREGSLEAPTRHPVNWKEKSFYDESLFFKELERVFDICHGCRRCVSLCTAFPTLFDLVDESSTMEVDGVDKKQIIGRLLINAIFVICAILANVLTFLLMNGTLTFLI